MGRCSYTSLLQGTCEGAPEEEEGHFRLAAVTWRGSEKNAELVLHLICFLQVSKL